MKLDARLLEKLQCPLCLGDIASSKKSCSLSCKKCNKKFPVFSGIPFFEVGLSKRAQEEAKRWNEMNIQEEYDFNDKISKYLMRIYKPMINYSLQCNEILEIGCGSGRLLKEISTQNKNAFVVGVDISINMLKVAQAKGLSSLMFAPAEALPFKKSSFDLILSGYYTFRYLERSRVYKDAYRILSKNGYLIFDIPNYWTVSFDYWLGKHFFGFHPSNINNLLKRNQLNIKSIDKEVREIESAGFQVKVLATPYFPEAIKKFFDPNWYYKGYFLSRLGYNIIFICRKTSQHKKLEKV